MKYITITSPDINNGLGFRVTLWISGCPHHCPLCHNEKYWSYDVGKEFVLDEVFNELSDILNKPYIKGLTLCGGEPLDITNQDKLNNILALVKKVKEVFGDTKDIWSYSGSTLEELQKSDTVSEILNYIDILVDGKFINDLKDTSLAFRGSSNQKIWKREKDGKFSEINL